MLKLMRDSFQHLRWILVAIVAAFILFIFVDWGAGGANGSAARGSGFAARVNGETITLRDFDRSLYYTEQRYKQMYGGQLSQDMIDQMGLPKQVLDGLVDQRLLLQEAQRMHLNATSEEVRKKILEIPILNPDGKFVGPEYYRRYITASGYQSPADFEDELARDITMQKMESALATAVMVSPKMADAEFRRISENAKIRYVLYPANREVATVNVTPAEVEAFYKANQTKYAHAEQRDMKYLMADFNRLRSQIIPPEADLKKRYEASRDQFKGPEAAHILHILIKVDPGAAPEVDAAAKAKAESLVKQLRAGADFATLAKANSGDPSSSSKGGDMGFVDRGTTVPEFDTRAFSIPLNSLQLVVETASKSDSPIDAAKVKTILQRRSLMYDKSGEEHYNIISALHKSVRNGDADAAVYWLVRMLEGGEDPLYIARRMVRAASEDIGNADPQALVFAIAVQQTVHFLGMPEAGVALAQLVTYLAAAPKSNAAYAGYSDAVTEVRQGDNPPVPLHIRNAPTRLMKDLGYGRGYKYAHDFEDQTAAMDCLPEALRGRRFYEPKDVGFEREIRERLEKMKKAREE